MVIETVTHGGDTGSSSSYSDSSAFCPSRAGTSTRSSFIFPHKDLAELRDEGAGVEVAADSCGFDSRPFNSFKTRFKDLSHSPLDAVDEEVGWHQQDLA